MKKFWIVLFCFFILSCCKSPKQGKETAGYDVSVQPVWSTDSVFKSPESVYYDADREVIYIANINGGSDDIDGNGFLSKMSPSGKIIALHWIDSLNGPKGMDVYGNKLYVTDINRIAEIDLDSDSIAAFYNIEGSEFLNDLTADNEGGVYFSDSQTNRIYYLKDGVSSIWLQSDSLGQPNGLYFDGDVMWHASSGKHEFQSINMDDQSITVIATGIGSADGVAPDGLGDFLVSDWSGQIFIIDSDGNKTKILDTRDQKINSADINFIIGSKTILVPTFNDNRIMAYRLIYKES